MVKISEQPGIENNAVLEDVRKLAAQLFKRETRQKKAFIKRVLDSYNMVKDKDTLIMHNPGGWGFTDIKNLIYWERNVVEGFKNTLTKMDRNWVLLQYFRASPKWSRYFFNLPEQIRFYFTGKFLKAKLLAAELNFLTEHIDNLKIFLLGVSQGAAFGNTVMTQVGNNPNIYSIELGTFFVHMKRRVLTERTLALDSNGIVPDPISHFRFDQALKAYVTAPYRWIKYRLQGKPAKFTYCVNVPGHEYRWEFPDVGSKIETFIAAKLGYRSGVEK
jgi:hypothetical protein